MIQALLLSVFSCAARCPCVVPEGVDWRSAAIMAPRARQGAYAVFRGTVARADTVARDTIRLAGQGQPSRPITQAKEIRYVVTVDRVWKGPRRRTLVLMSYQVNTDCGRDYAVGGIYLVYADRDRRAAGATQLSTSSCSRVLSGLGADADLELLGPGRVPK
jgi:hypothetical protein